MAKKTVTDDFSVFSRRLSQLMKDHKLKQQDLADALGIKRQTVSVYMNGQSTPDAEILRKISICFNVSSDYLLGLTDTPTVDTNLRTVCEYTGLTESAVEWLANFKNKPAYMREVNEVLSSDAFHLIITCLRNYRAHYSAEIVFRGLLGLCNLEDDAEMNKDSFAERVFQLEDCIDFILANNSKNSTDLSALKWLFSASFDPELSDILVRVGIIDIEQSEMERMRVLRNLDDIFGYYENEAANTWATIYADIKDNLNALTFTEVADN